MKPHQNNISLASIFFPFLRLGLTAFGGPSMVAYIRELSVNKHQWLDEGTFKNGVALCQSIPGATAIQVAGYVGLKTKGLAGAFASYIGFGLPAFFFMLVLSWAYMRMGNLSWVISLFNGLQVVVVAIVANATFTFGRGTVRQYRDCIVAVLSASAFWYGISPFYVVVGAGISGIILFKALAEDTKALSYEEGRISLGHLIIPILITGLFMLVLFLIHRGLFDIALLMMKIDLFAFGGGFASVPLMLQEVVNVHGWMDSKTFMDGIALGQVTPGPIVITATFVGFLTYGIAGAIVATFGIFNPSFIMLIIGSQVFSRLQRSAIFNRSLKGILASFVGLLLFVTIKFATAVPWDIMKLVIVIAAIIALLKRVEILYIVLIGGLISIVLL